MRNSWEDLLKPIKLLEKTSEQPLFSPEQESHSLESSRKTQPIRLEMNPIWTWFQEVPLELHLGKYGKMLWRWRWDAIGVK